MEKRKVSENLVTLEDVLKKSKLDKTNEKRLSNLRSKYSQDTAMSQY